MDSQEEADENPLFPIDLSIFKESFEQNFITILDLIPKEEKCLIIEESLLTKFGYFIKTDFLETKCLTKKIFLLENIPPNIQLPILLYIIPPKKECLIMIEKHIKDNFDKTSMLAYIHNKEENKKKKKEEEIKEIKKEFHIIFIPKISNECNQFLKDSDYNSFYHIYNLNMDIFPLDYDLISLENESAFYDLFISENLNIISVLVRAIIKYENIYGKIKYKYYLGNLAKKLYNLLIKEEEVSPTIDKANDPGTFSCFIFDRSVDMITPLCSNFIYEGLLDEYFGINLNSIKIPIELIGKKVSENKKKDEIKLDLSKKDKLYTQIKDYNFDKIKKFFVKRLNEHNKMLEQAKDKNNIDLKQIEESLLKIKLVSEERTSLKNHLNLADFISNNKKLPKEQLFLFYEQNLLLGETPSTFFESIEDEIAKKGDLYNIIRMISLYSLINGGIKNKLYDQIKKDLINIYGFQEIFFLNNLEKLKILKYYNSSNIFYYDFNKKLELINESVDFFNPNDSSYSFSGYCPIFIRLIEKAISKGWFTIKDLIKKISNDCEFPNDEDKIININKKEKKFILLVFIGGITYGELASIRYLNNALENIKFIVITTAMINTKKIFNSLLLGKYKYLPKDNNYFNNSGKNNNCQIKLNDVLTFKDFYEQMNKI